MATPKMEAEDQEEALFTSALYYVESPYTASHANSMHPSSDHQSSLLSPFPHEKWPYSSSRGSNNSFLHHDQKKLSCESILKSGRLKIVDRIGDYQTNDDGMRSGSGIWRYIALDPSSSCCCVAFQVSWRFLVSFGVALLVFFLMTKPPPPELSSKVVGFKQFSLGEGLDNTGVITKILSINCSVNMAIDNNSKLFTLHMNSPILEMAFGRLKLAQSQGPESYIDSKSSYMLDLHVAARDKPVYGAGRSMQDLLESGQGLPLMIRLRSRLSYRVVWSLIRLKYLHHEECLLVLSRAFDEKHRIHVQNSTCSTSTHHA